MKTQTHSAGSFRCLLLTLASLALLAAPARAQVPTMMSYQGRVLMDSTNFTGNGQFKFALVQGAGPTLLWKNDGSPGDAEPAAAVTLAVANGLVMTLLGDTALAGMTAIPTTVFVNSDVRLRVWFNGGAGFQQLTPDQRIVSVGYAMMSATVPDGAITSAKLAPGAINSAQLADTIALGATNVIGRLDVYRTAANTPAIKLDGASSAISTFGSDGLEQIRLHGTSYGELLLRNSLVNNATAVNLTAQGSTGGRLTLNNTNGSSRAILEGENTGGLLTLYQADGNTGAVLYGNDAGSGALSLRNTNGSPRLRAYGGPTSGSLELFDVSGTRTFLAQGAESATTGSQLLMYESDGSLSLQLDGEQGTGGGGYLAVYEGDGTTAMVADADSQGGSLAVYEQDGTLTTWIHNVSDAGVVSLRNPSGAETVYLWGIDSASTGGGQIGLKASGGTETVTIQAAEVAGNGAQIILRKSDGSVGITLDAEQSGDSHITTQVLTITGGADLSENFNINEAETQPGMIVSIDPKQPGELLLSREAYDQKVAGVVSGAGGVRPGMLMGQAGTKADGKHPIALTGRVYCWVDASHGAILPGDMITSSPTPGHGMKAADRERAFGSIIGKAMTGLDHGKGLVLVLVSLQ